MLPSPVAVGTLLLVALVGRLPLAMTNLALLLLARDQGHSYAVAGGIAGAATVALGLAAPRIGRAADHVGAVPVLLVTGAVGTAATLLIGFIPGGLGVPGLVVLALIAGAFTPPIATVYRAALPRLVASGRLGHWYGLEAACQEATYVVGPMLVVTMVATVGAQAAVIVCGVLTGIVSVVFAAAVARYAVRRGREERTGSVLRNARLRRLLVAYTIMGGTFGAVEVAAVAALDHMGRRSAAGVVLGAWALGSLVGGLVVPRLWRADPAHRLPILIGVLAALGVPIVLAGAMSPLALGVALALEGVAIAPVVGTVYEYIPRLTPASTLTEAFSWSIGSAVVGSSVGLAVAGVLASRMGPAAGLTLAVVFPALSVAWLRTGGRPTTPEGVK